MKWEMIHYDVQLFGGVVLHQGKIAEMATGEGKTLVGTTPIFLNALTGNGVHVVTVNDYLAKRDSEWMGPLYMFHGLSVDCIDKHRPNSDERRKAYLADITFGTNNEFGFDYLRDNMATNPADLVQRQHNYAIVDEVDSVLIDDARTPLIISGPIPKGDDQMFEQYQPLVEKLYEVQRKQATELLAEAKQKITEGTKAKNQELLDEGFLALFRSYKALPKNKPLIKYLSEEGIKAGLLKTEEYYMSTTTGHWMGPSTVVKEGFVFEVEGTPDSDVCLKVDNYEYHFTIRELMKTSRIKAQYQESIDLANRVYGKVDHYRDDFYWHNAYKTRIRQAVPQDAYVLNYEKEIDMEAGANYRLRVWLKNGDVAWVSPIFVEK